MKNALKVSTENGHTKVTLRSGQEILLPTVIGGKELNTVKDVEKALGIKRRQ